MPPIPELHPFSGLTQELERLSTALSAVELRLAGIAGVAIVLLVIGWRLREKRPGYGLMLQGGGVVADWLIEVGRRENFVVQSTSVPGVAQRTGATTYYVEVHPQPDTVLAGRQPVFSLNPVPGGIDLLVSSELLETVRQVGAGMASADRTLIVSSTARVLTVAEKMQLGDGRADTAALLAMLQRHAHGVDAGHAAADRQTPIACGGVAVEDAVERVLARVVTSEARRSARIRVTDTTPSLNLPGLG